MSIWPNCHAAKKSLNVSITSSSNSDFGLINPCAVTSPTGWNLSPILNECPDLATSNSFTLYKDGLLKVLVGSTVWPIPVVTIPTNVWIAEATFAHPVEDCLRTLLSSALTNVCSYVQQLKHQYLL